MRIQVLRSSLGIARAEYARAITEGAPGALQVADRWHLLKNLRDTLERELRRSHARLDSFSANCPKAGASAAAALQDRRGPFWRSQPEEDASQASRARRLAPMPEGTAAA